MDGYSANPPIVVRPRRLRGLRLVAFIAGALIEVFGVFRKNQSRFAVQNDKSIQEKISLEDLHLIRDRKRRCSHWSCCRANEPQAQWTIVIFLKIHL